MMELLKFITAGNVDDGKSTLIGRLLYDSNALSNDILETVSLNNGEINFAYLTDGLKAEREQGITIDVAYKYFSTEKRKFIIADCPGHKEYTRNMITGASHADVAIILIDAKQGITEQTRRHTFIVDLMNIPCIIFCINKMDAVGYSEEVFNSIVEKLDEFVFLNKHQIEKIPVSALKGDNVVHRSENMKWYEGNTLMYVLENFHPENKMAELPAFMQVQYVSFQNDDRYYFGTLYNNNIKVGEEVVVYPTKQKNKIKEIFVLGKSSDTAKHLQPIAVTLVEDNDIQRGYYLVSEKNILNEESSNKVSLNNQFNAVCFWFDENNFIPSKRYYIQHHSFRTYMKCELSEIFDLDTLKFNPSDNSNISMNSIFKVRVTTAHPLLISDYRDCMNLGSFIIIDETSYKTVGAGIVMN
ncbi:MAG TPA: GTP-binding protein [Bacteroidia bacterium]|nr:GTP-binding protein [Bacteroidia bacterium]